MSKEEMVEDNRVRKLSQEALTAWAEYDPPEFKHASTAIRDAFFAGWFSALRTHAASMRKGE